MGLIFILAKKRKKKLGEKVVLDLSKKLENTNCIPYFDNFFTSPTLVEKLFDKGIYCFATVRSGQTNMAIMKKDEDMKRRNIDFQYANNVVAVKCFDNHGVAIVGTCLEEYNKVSTVTRIDKGQSANIPVRCPEIIKDSNSSLGGVDLLNQNTAADELDRKSSGGRYYLRLFFNLIDIFVVNSRAICKVLYPKGME